MAALLADQNFEDEVVAALAARIHAAITSAQALAGQLVRIIRPNPPKAR